MFSAVPRHGAFLVLFLSQLGTIQTFAQAETSAPSTSRLTPEKRAALLAKLDDAERKLDDTLAALNILPHALLGGFAGAAAGYGAWKLALLWKATPAMAVVVGAGFALGAVGAAGYHFLYSQAFSEFERTKASITRELEQATRDGLAASRDRNDAAVTPEAAPRRRSNDPADVEGELPRTMRLAN